MAIIENRVTEDGDILVIKPEVPIIGLISLTQFVDTTIGEDLENYFLKEFRYSQDGGLNFSNWIQLTLQNIQSVSISKFDTFVIEYKYTRIGNVPEVELEFENILVSGEIEDLPNPIYDKTYFSDFFNVNNINVFGWAINVLEKIYIKGLILPDFYERGNNRSNLEDEDFIAYWNAITHLFAIIVYYARQFENIAGNNVLLEEFLKSKDLMLPADRNPSDMLYLFQNYVNEYKKRGTLSILDQKENGKNIDGELIRLIDHQIIEELTFALFQNFESGWCISKSSPTWKGTEFIKNIRKGYEFQNEVKDLSKYPLIDDFYISIVDGKIVISSILPNETYSGIADNLNNNHKIIIDPRVDYEISFFVKQSSLQNGLIFGCDVFDVNGDNLICKKSTEEVNSNYFAENFSLNVVDQFYLIRGILWNTNKKFGTLLNQNSDINDKLNIGIGNNLILPNNATHIVPIIINEGTLTPCEVVVYGIVIRPLKLNFSRGQLGMRNLIYLLSVNNNDQYSENQLRNIIQKKLIPYNCFLKSNWIK